MKLVGEFLGGLNRDWFPKLALSMRQRWKMTGDFVVYVAVRFLIGTIQALPLSWCQALCDRLAWLCCDLLHIRANVVEDNLSHAFPESTFEERRRIERRMWRHLFMMLCEIALASRKVHQSNWRDHYRLINGSELVGAFLDDRPLIAMTAHFGNFEMCGYISGLLGFPTFTLARTLDNPFLNRWFLEDFRQATGQFILHTKGTAELAQTAIANKQSLALLGDHFGGKKGCWVEFFNRPASCHKSFSLMSLATKTPMVFVYSRRRGGLLDFELVCDGYFDPEEAGPDMQTVPDVTRWYNSRIEEAVRQAPDQYWWLHRRWKDPRKKKTQAA